MSLQERLKNSEKEFERYGKEVIKQARANLTRGKHNVTKELYNSLKYSVKSSENSISQSFTGSIYADFQDKGVKGRESSSKAPNSPYQYRAKMANYEAVLTWVSNRKIQFRTNGGQFMSFRSTAFIVARSIAKTGIPATNFFTKPATKQGKILRKKLQNSLALDFAEFVVSVNS